MGLPAWQGNRSEKGRNRFLFRSEINTTTHLIIIWSASIIIVSLLFKSDFAEWRENRNIISRLLIMFKSVYVQQSATLAPLQRLWKTIVFRPYCTPIQLSNQLWNLKILFQRVKESSVGVLGSLKSTTWSLICSHSAAQRELEWREGERIGLHSCVETWRNL